MSRRRQPLFCALLPFLFTVQIATADHKYSRYHPEADRLVSEMERAIHCIVTEYTKQFRSIRPTNDQRVFNSASINLKHAVRRLRSAFDGGSYSRAAYEFNQLENRFKSANRYRDRANVSPSVRCHLDTTARAIAAFKRLRSYQYGLED